MRINNYINPPMNFPSVPLPSLFGGFRPQAVPAAWFARVRQRRALAALDSRLLRDIGLDRQDVLREVSKPFWRV